MSLNRQANNSAQPHPWGIFVGQPQHQVPMPRLANAPVPYCFNPVLAAAQLQALAKRGTPGRNTWDKERLYKTKMCSYFLRGKCKFGEGCSYAHGGTELQARPNFYKTKMCNKPKCTNWACPYAHSIYELRDPPCSANTALRPGRPESRPSCVNSCPIVDIPTTTTTTTTTTGGLTFIGSSRKNYF